MRIGAHRRSSLVCCLLPVILGCAAGPRAASTPAAKAQTLGTQADRARLEAVAAARANGRGGGYRIGPDDLLAVRVPDLIDAAANAARLAPATDRLTAILASSPVFEQGARVSAVGDITLPLLGTVPVAGLTPGELEAELARRLVRAGLLRRPQVSVQVAEYRSRVVAVVGSVERPGLYPLTRPGATLADLVWAAGGPSKDAGRLISFVPGAEGAPPAAGSAPDLARLDQEPILVDLELLLHGAGESARPVDPEVRPGDLISLAPAGNVHVQGWVQKPGSYPITRNLTLSGAVAAAGGHLYPADLRRVMMKRALPAADAQAVTVDLDRVAQGIDPDPPVADGDVVQVDASLPRIVPYGAWSLVNALVHVGATVPLF